MLHINYRSVDRRDLEVRAEDTHHRIISRQISSVQNGSKGVVETNKIILLSVVPMQYDSSIFIDNSEDVLTEHEFVSCCHDVGEGQNVMVRNGYWFRSLHITWD